MENFGREQSSEVPFFGFEIQELFKGIGIEKVLVLENKGGIEGISEVEKEPNMSIEIEKERFSESNLKVLRGILKETKEGAKLDYLKIEGLEDTREKTVKIYILLEKTGFSAEDVIKVIKDLIGKLEEKELF
jgi:hypothetical protein